MRRVPDLTSVLTVLGLLALAGSIALPVATARRVARIETRAAAVADLLLEVARRAEQDGEALSAENLGAKLAALCRAQGQPDSDLPELVAAADTPVFGNRHYLFRVERRPPPERRPTDWDPDARRALDAYAWPRRLGHPGRSVFYAPEDGRRAYTRNLVAGYHGLEHPPEPGAGVSAGQSERGDREGYYRSHSGERWLWTDPALPR